MAWVNGKSGTYNISTENSVISGYVKWEEKYDVTTNKSLITQTAYLHRTNIYAGETFFASAVVTRTAYFDSETVGSTVTTGMSLPGNTSSSGGAYVQVYTASKEVAHNADGTKNVTLGFSMSNSETGVAAKSFTVPKTTTTVSLTPIPRATVPSLSVTMVEMGQTINVTLTPAVSTFKHKIRYEFAGLLSQIDGVKRNGTQITADYLPGGTYTFTPPTSLANKIPDANTGTAKLIVYTYKDDNTHIGTNSVNIALGVPDYVPTIKKITVSPFNHLGGECVQGKTSLSVDVSAESSYGATIKKVTVVVDGKTYEGSGVETAILQTAGSKTVDVTVVDSRSRSAIKKSDAFTVHAYSAPVISAFTLERQSDGTTVIATVKGSIASYNNKNAKTITVTLNGVTKTITSSSYTINGTATFTNVPTDYAITGTATIKDSYTSTSADFTVPSIEVTMDFHNSGKGIAMGKVAEKEKMLDVAWEIKTDKPEKTLANLSFRGSDPIKKASEDTLSYWASQGNLATAFFTSSTEDMVKPSTWGYLLHIASKPGTKEFHQLWLEQSNGSIHHRGGNASALNSWKMMLDNSNCPDFVVEQKTQSGWQITKWKNGKIELFCEKDLSFDTGAKQADNLYRSIVQLDLSGLVTDIMSGTCAVQVNGMVPQVCRHSSTHTLAEIVIVTSRTFSAFTLTNAPIYIIGKWN